MAAQAQFRSNVRSAVNNVAVKLFVDGQTYLKYRKAYDIRKGNECTTSLPLQMALYFNVLFFPAWVISSSLTLYTKYGCLDPLYKVVMIALFIMMCLVESIRLYIGYLGNLTEKVPELAGSWLLSILLQFPSTLFLLFNYKASRSMPLEIVMNALLTLFVVCEILIGAIALKAMVNHQVSVFHMQQFIAAEDIPESLNEPPANVGETKKYQ